MVTITHRLRVHGEREGAERPEHTQARLAAAGAVCGGVLLLLIGDGIFRNPGDLDYRLLDAIQSLRLSSLEPALEATRTVTALPWALVVWGMVAAAFVFARSWSIAVQVLLVPLMVGIANLVLGGLVTHAGPDPVLLERVAGDPATSSFPSGQVVGAVLLAGLLTAAAARSRLAPVRIGLTLVAVAAIGMTGLAELWLGAHWPTDVLAGYAFGGLMLAFFVTLERWFASAVDGLAPRAAVRGAKVRFAAGEDRASGWLENAVARWEREGRLTAGEAAELRAEIEAPQFRAVLPHFGVHLSIGVALRFPFGSIARGSYVLANMLIATGRFLTRRIDRRRWRQSLGIHAPLVLVVACLPGVGTFAYLVSKPIRSNHLLLRVALDTALRKAPARLYDRTGLARAVARPTGWASEQARPVETSTSQGRFLTIGLPAPQAVAKFLAGAAAVLFAADLAMQTVDDRYGPDIHGWSQALRILDLGSETSLGTWFSVVGLFLCATLFGVIAYATRREGGRFQRHWWFLALVFLGFSLDEQAKFHDPGGGGGDVWRERLGLSGPLYYGWVLVALFSVVVLAFLYRRFIFALPAMTRTLSFIAAALYVGGEVGAEMITGWLMDTRGAGLLYNTFTSVEEFMGLLGIMVALSALLAYVRQYLGELRIGIGSAGAAGQAAVSPSTVNGSVRWQTIHSPVLTTREEVGNGRLTAN